MHAQVLFWWQEKNTSLFHLTPPYPPSVLVCAGDFPWVEGSASATVTSAHRHFAQRYRHARAQHRRSMEERTILHAEVVRLFNGLEEREAALRSCLEQQRSAAGAAGAGSSSATADAGGSISAAAAAAGPGSISAAAAAAGAGSISAAADSASSSAAAGAAGGSAGAGGAGGLWPNVLAAGKAKMLEIELSRLQLMHAEATKLLRSYLPK